MTGNNKIWRASLAGLASVAMLATMGVAASTANADGAATVPDYDFTVTLHANTPSGVNTAAEVNGKDSDSIDFNTLDTNDNSKLDELYSNAAPWTVSAPAGWQFTGWYTAANYGAEKFDFNDTVVTKHIDLYAHWAEPDQTVNVTFDNAAGVYDLGETVYAGQTKAKSSFVNFNGSDYSLAVAKQDGKVADWELPADKADNKIVDTWAVKGNASDTLTLNDLTNGFASKLQGNYGPYNLTLTPNVPKDDNAGIVQYTYFDHFGVKQTKAKDVKFGEKVPTTPTLDGAVISKWYYLDAKTGVPTEWPADKILTTDYRHLDLLAGGASTDVYTVNYYTYVAGQKKLVASEPVKAGESPKGAYTPSRDGYTFAGWSESNGVNQKTVALSSLKITGDKDLFAQWTTNKAGVTYNYNYADKVESKSYAAGQEFTTPTPSRAGYQFLGWYYNPSVDSYGKFTSSNPFPDYNLDKPDDQAGFYFVKAYLPGKNSTKAWGWVDDRKSDTDTTATSSAKWLKKYNKKVTSYYSDAVQVPENAKLRINGAGELEYLSVNSNTTADGTTTTTDWVTIPSTLYAAWGRTNATDLNNAEQQIPSKDDNGDFIADNGDFVNYPAYAAAMKEYFALKDKYGATPTDEQVSELTSKLDAAQALLQEKTNTPVYRLYNPYNHGDHLYTTDYAEYQKSVKAGWVGEGPQFNVLSENKYGLSTAVYRVYNPYNGEHLLSTSSSEVADLVKAGWLEDNGGEPVFYAPQGGDVAVTRLFNPYETVGTHLYSTNADEIASNVKAGWVKEEAIFSTR